MYRIVRVLTCDCEDCNTPAPFVLQGEDDDAIKEGWTEYEVKGRKLHCCPSCTDLGRIPTSEPAHV